MVILNNLKNILNHKFLIFTFLLIGFSAYAVPTASAKTINSSVTFMDESRKIYFENLFKRSSYKNYLLVVDNYSSGYTNFNDYYFCLTNEKIEISNELNAKVNCGVIYRYYRGNDSYVLEKYNDNKLEAINSIYYTDNDKDDRSTYFIIGIFILLAVLLFCLVL